ncbi:uncharacterized protein V1518DRAFT_418664 [Limtongia smithiae]|uniref:uncharacterized protein n=1 Tax=Limtongia smithiae TaxID=1125753 RepID=UPI0034CE0312
MADPVPKPDAPPPDESAASQPSPQQPAVPAMSIESILGLMTGLTAPPPPPTGIDTNKLNTGVATYDPTASVSIPTGPAALVPASEDANDSKLFFVDEAQSDSGSSLSSESSGERPTPSVPLPPQSHGFQNRRRQGNSFTLADLSTPYTPDEEAEYEQYIKDEGVNVQRNEWERFEPGSRLFIGNLPTDNLNKRHLFKIFHGFGRLAQISIKQAYGFVQYNNADDCSRAIEAVQGTSIQGRKMHLEVSKPQGAKKDKGRQFDNNQGRPQQQQQQQRRSASPERRGSNRLNNRFPNQNLRQQQQQQGGSYGGYLTRQDDGEQNRGRGDFDRRDNSPSRGRSDRLYRERSPLRRNASPAGEDWPFPRRRVDDIPDIQILVIERLDRNFVYFVEKAFKDRGLKVDIVDMSPRVNMSAIIRQTILEGVSTVAVLTNDLQDRSQVSMQVFEKLADNATARFDEYRNLDPPVAAEIVWRAKQSRQPNAAAAAAAAAAFGLLGSTLYK